MCPCGRVKAYRICCRPYHRGKAKPATAECLMRSRYSAYVMAQVDYLAETQLDILDRMQAKSFAKKAKWKHLQVLDVTDGLAGDQQGTVEFKATYFLDGQLEVMHEISYFEKREGAWVYIGMK